MLNYLCEPRIKNHGEVRSARRNFISLPGFIFSPYPACTEMAAWRTANKQHYSSFKFHLFFSDYLLGKLNKRWHGRIAKALGQEIECCLPYLGFFASMCKKKGGGSTEGWGNTNNLLALAFWFLKKCITNQIRQHRKRERQRVWLISGDNSCLHISKSYW